MKTALIVICALIAVQPAFAEGKGKETKKAKPVRVAAVSPKPVAIVKPSPPKHPWVGHTVTISPSERDVIRAYVRNCIDASKLGKPNGVSQGLTKKVGWGSKPPAGWRAKCIPGDVLPVEVHKHCHSLPEEVIVKLPPPPPGTVLLAVDGRIVRIGYPTYEILDSFDVL